MHYSIKIGWLYPELMSTYGDHGNIIVLTKRCEWRDIAVEVKRLDVGFKTTELASCDLLFMGGAQDLQQKIVSNDLSKDKIKTLQEMIEDETPGLYICGAYQFLGKYYKEADETIIPGLDILDLYTENSGENHKRLIGNIIVEADTRFKLYDSRKKENRDKPPFFVGFENHGGRTYLGKNITPLGKVIKGFGNNGKDNTEGAIYKNSFGSYMHGPILPKNPHFADYLIHKALEKKYKKDIVLSPLMDHFEWQAHDTVLQKVQ